MASIFTRIINGELPGYFVWKDDVAVALMTIQPIREGHVLVIPRAEIDHWDDLPAATASHLMGISQQIAKAMKTVYPCTRIGLIIAGLEVPHTHVHLLPIDEFSDLSFAAARPAAAETLRANAEQIRSALRHLGHRQADF
jgi:histidine triad (HIT) family protein